MQISAQNTEDLAEKVKSDGTYMYGEGWGNTYSEADNSALSALISKISISLSSTFTVKEEEINVNSSINSKTAVNSVVNTYAQASLTNTENIVISNEPNAHVLRYIKKSEISKIFNERKDKVDDYIHCAIRAEQKGKIDDALRYYYWGYCLLKSLQYPNEVAYEDNGTRRLLINWIPQQINAILDDLSAKIAAVDGNNVSVFISYKGSPVTSVDFKYFDGQSWSSICSAKDGLGSIEMRPGASCQNLQLRYEYEYFGESHIDKELETVMALFRGTSFSKALTVIGEKSVNDVARKEYQAAIESESKLNINEVNNPKDYIKTIEYIVKAIKTKNYNSLSQYFTNEGLEMFNKLLKYGNAKIIGEPNFAFYPMDGRVICRSIPMNFSFDNNNRKFVEDVTFTFNADKKIESIAFGLGKIAKTDIFNKGIGKWSDHSKMILASFLENYKTAFALKRIDYLKSIFDDNAVIITGHIVKKTAPILENQCYISNKYVVYNRQSKNEYIKSLERCFSSNQFVNIRFANNDIIKMGTGGEVYGIQIKQDYYSSSYGDTGYLFLLVDINDSTNPIIKVRTWQPHRDSNVNSLLPKDNPDYGIIGPGNF